MAGEDGIEPSTSGSKPDAFPLSYSPITGNPKGAIPSLWPDWLQSFDSPARLSALACMLIARAVYCPRYRELNPWKQYHSVFTPASVSWISAFAISAFADDGI